MSAPPTNDISRFESEIDRLHRLFVQWFTGCIDNTNENFAEIEGSLAENFHLVNPQGLSTPRATLLEALKKSYNSREGQVYRIECKQVQLLHASKGSYLVSYEEWQQVQETETARIVSAWFRDDPSSGEIKWIHVHETWMTGKAPPTPATMWSP